MNFKKFPVDELLKEKPETLSCLNPIDDEGNFSMDINRVKVFDIRNHKIVYGKNYAIIKFYNKNGVQLANLSAFGSCNGDKPDESFYVGYGEIMS
ncbi:MAG: hypothetical protein M0P49_02535, partial [Bacilli bacterium]|nr:hypothetical protein [Bacilli bacterium]